MEVTIRQEEGYDLALYGMSLSFKDRSINPNSWWPLPNFVSDTSSALTIQEANNRSIKMVKVATANANRGNGHNKFRRQIMLWIDIEAPRFWWSEFDTYKVGTVTQSESTMHTLSKRDMTINDLENPDVWDRDQVNTFNKFKKSNTYASIEQLKRKVPESYLQRRLVTCNYEVLATIINQRKNHRLPQWKVFIEAIYNQVEHTELLPEYPY